jgi:hypothetical protein
VVLRISLQASGGVSRKNLLQIVEDTLAAWPVLNPQRPTRTVILEKVAPSDVEELRPYLPFALFAVFMIFLL